MMQSFASEPQYEEAIDEAMTELLQLSNNTLAATSRWKKERGEASAKQYFKQLATSYNEQLRAILDKVGEVYQAITDELSEDLQKEVQQSSEQA